MGLLRFGRAELFGKGKKSKLGRLRNADENLRVGGLTNGAEVARLGADFPYIHLGGKGTCV